MATGRGRTTVDQMVAGGLYVHTYWVTQVLQSATDRVEFLREQYPDATLGSINAAIRRLEQASQAGLAFQQMGVPLNPSQIPVDPSSRYGPGYTYLVNVEFDFIGRGQGGLFQRESTGRLLYLHFSQQVDETTLLTHAIQQFNLFFNRGGISDNVQGQVIQNSVHVEIVSITRT